MRESGGGEEGREDNKEAGGEGKRKKETQENQDKKKVGTRGGRRTETRYWRD